MSSVAILSRPALLLFCNTLPFKSLLLGTFCLFEALQTGNICNILNFRLYTMYPNWLEVCCKL